LDRGVELTGLNRTEGTTQAGKGVAGSQVAAAVVGVIACFHLIERLQPFADIESAAETDAARVAGQVERVVVTVVHLIDRQVHAAVDLRLIDLDFLSRGDGRCGQYSGDSQSSQ